MIGSKFNSSVILVNTHYGKYLFFIDIRRLNETINTHVTKVQAVWTFDKIRKQRYSLYLRLDQWQVIGTSVPGCKTMATLYLGLVINSTISHMHIRLQSTLFVLQNSSRTQRIGFQLRLFMSIKLRSSVQWRLNRFFITIKYNHAWSRLVIV